MLVLSFPDVPNRGTLMGDDQNLARAASSELEEPIPGAETRRGLL